MKMKIKLDPDLAAVVEEGRVKNPDAPHPADVPLDLLRTGYVLQGQLQAKADLACQTVYETTIEHDDCVVPVRVYRAAESDVLDPGLIFIHGGGFTIGNLDSHDSLCRQFAIEASVTVIALNYRLAPEHKFPAAVDDCLAATRHILSSCETFRLQPGKIALAGDSAGGNLSAVVCNELNKAGEPTPACQILIYPATRMVNFETKSRRELDTGVTLDKRLIDYFNDMYLGGIDYDEDDPRLNPALVEDLSGLPPAHIITAEYDPLRDEGEEYGRLLNQAGVAASYHCYEGLMHNFILQTAVVSAADRAVKDCADFLKHQLQ